MQRNFGRNSGFRPVSAEIKIRECFGKKYLNFRAFILPLLSVERAVFGKTEKLKPLFRTKTAASFCENGSKYSKISECSQYFATRNISLHVNCAAKRSQNLQKSEFIKPLENSNSFVRNFCDFPTITL